MDIPPNPGSEQALRQGCTCPVLDNNHGKGIVHGPKGVEFWTDENCPLHGSPTPKPSKKGE